MKVLIIHHVEALWCCSFVHSEDDYIKKILDYVEDNYFDTIIMTTMEGSWYEELYQICDVHHEWGYNWENPEEYANEYRRADIDPEDIICSLGHEYTYLYPWIKALKHDDITLIGGGESECLLDLEVALDYLNIPNTKNRTLTY